MGSAPCLAPLLTGVNCLELLDLLPFRVVMKGLDGRYIYMNRAAAIAHGHDDPKDAYGKTDADYFESSQVSQWRKVEEKVLACGDYPPECEEFETWLDGRKSWVQTFRAPARNEFGDIIAIFYVVKDITNIKSELNHYRHALKSARFGIWHSDAVTKETYFSEGWKRILGFEANELANSREAWASRVHPDDLGRVKAEVRLHEQKRVPFYECEYRMKNKNGDYGWIRSRGAITYDDTGNCISFAGVHEDVDEFNAMKSLAHTALDAFPGLVFVKCEDGRFQYGNEGLAQLFGTDKASLVGKRDADFFQDEDLVRRFEANDRIVFETGKQLHISKESITDCVGNVKIFATTKRPLPTLTQFGASRTLIGFAVDITEMQSSRNELANERRLMDQVLDHLPDAIFIKDRNGRYSLANSTFAKMVGFDSPKELKEHSNSGSVNLPIGVFSGKSEDTFFDKKGQAVSKTIKIDTPRGPRHWKFNIVPIPDHQGRVGQICGIAQDITELVRQKDEAQSKWRLLDTILKHLPQRIFLKDSDGRYLLYNRAWARAHRLKKPRSFLGKQDSDYWPPEIAQRLKKADDLALTEKIAHTFTEHLPENGRLTTLRTTKIGVPDVDGKITVLGISEDITQELEKDKVRFMQDMSFNFAHSIKGWLTLLPGSLRHLSNLYPILNDQPAFQRIHTAVNYLTRSSANALQIYSLRTTRPSTTFSPDEAIRGVLATVHDERIKYKCSDNGLLLQGCEIDFQNAILHLAENAIRHAPKLEDGGKIRVRFEKSNSHCMIRFTNNGPSVPDDIRENIFRAGTSGDPSRTGIGLSFVKMVMESLGGTIILDDSQSGVAFVATLQPYKEPVCEPIV